MSHPLSTGERVYATNDPRRVGTVVETFDDGKIVRVEWDGGKVRNAGREPWEPRYRRNISDIGRVLLRRIES